VTRNYLPQIRPARILLTSGASCPDALVEGVIRKLAGFYSANIQIGEIANNLENSATTN
jgi:4-hydroxy-3-methylbut-2-enyl diphosphate reductase